MHAHCEQVLAKREVCQNSTTSTWSFSRASPSSSFHGRSSGSALPITMLGRQGMNILCMGFSRDTPVFRISICSNKTSCSGSSAFRHRPFLRSVPPICLYEWMDRLRMRVVSSCAQRVKCTGVRHHLRSLFLGQLHYSPSWLGHAAVVHELQCPRGHRMRMTGRSFSLEVAFSKISISANKSNSYVVPPRIRSCRFLPLILQSI